MRRLGVLAMSVRGLSTLADPWTILLQLCLHFLFLSLGKDFDFGQPAVSGTERPLGQSNQAQAAKPQHLSHEVQQQQPSSAGRPGQSCTIWIDV